MLASALPGPSAPSMFRCRPGCRSAPRRRPPRRGDAADDVAASAATGRRRSSRARRRAPRRRRRADRCTRPRRSQPRPCIARSTRRSPAADDPDGPRVFASERARGDGGGGARAQRGDRARVQEREREAGAGVGQADDAADGRQAVRRVPRKRRDPLEQREIVAASRHRAEVAVAVGSGDRPSPA